MQAERLKGAERNAALAEGKVRAALPAGAAHGQKTPAFHSAHLARRGFKRRNLLSLERLENRWVLDTAGPTDPTFEHAEPTSCIAHGKLNSAQLNGPPSLGAYDPSTGTETADSKRDPLSFLEKPGIQVDQGLWWLGSGPKPSELRLRSIQDAAAADTINVDALWSGGSSGLNLTGAGVTVGVWDEGIVRTAHRDLVGRVTLGESASQVIGDSASQLNSHATHVAGTIGGTGIWPVARGTASGVNIVSFDWFNDLQELEAASAAGLITIGNHSYGDADGWAYTGADDVWLDERDLFDLEDSSFGVYSELDAQIDDLLYRHPELLSVWSAGNDRNDGFSDARRGTDLSGTYLTYLSHPPANPSVFGPPTPEGWYRVHVSEYPPPPTDGDGGLGFDSLGPGKTAKNTLVIGSVGDYLQDPIPANEVVSSDFSSWGPTDDGRIKPDLVANGEGVWAPIASGDSHYSSYTGTSMAAPSASGSAALLTELYQRLHNTIPLASTLKGLLIQTAMDVRAAGPDYETGWGLIDASAAASLLSGSTGPSALSAVKELEFRGYEQTFTVQIDEPQSLKASIAWSDPAANGAAPALDSRESKLVHNLDLWITGPSGEVHFPWTLNPAAPQEAATRSRTNGVDNVEQVLIDAAPSGLYTIHVNASAAWTQKYSLIVNQQVIADTAAPTASIVPVSPDPREESIASVEIVFSEPVEGFTLEQLSLTLSAEGNINRLTSAQTLTSSDQRIYVLSGLSELTSESGAYQLTIHAEQGAIRDFAGNALVNQVSEEWTKVDDLTPPTVAISPIEPDPTSLDVESVSIVFSEPVTGFGLEDIALFRSTSEQTNLLEGSQAILSTTDSQTFVLSSLGALTSRDGVYRLQIQAAGSLITDNAGNALALDSLETWRRQSDLTPPTVLLGSVTPTPTPLPLETLTITFSEGVTGFEMQDLILVSSLNPQLNLLGENQSLASTDGQTFVLSGLSSVTANTATYQLSLSNTAGIMDLSGNLLASGSVVEWTKILDATPPSVVISPVEPDPRSLAVASIVIEFTEPVLGFDLSDLRLHRINDGSGNLLREEQTLSTIDQRRYELSDLSAITEIPGAYVLTLASATAGITDLVGNPLVRGALEHWVNSEASSATVAIVTLSPKVIRVKPPVKM